MIDNQLGCHEKLKEEIYRGPGFPSLMRREEPMCMGASKSEDILDMFWGYVLGGKDCGKEKD